MSRRRSQALVVCAVLALGTAGCLGFLAGDESLSFEADAATVDTVDLGSTGYDIARSESPNRTVSVSVAGESRNVSVATEIREYSRNVSVGGQETAVASFSVYSFPAVDIEGETVNPFSDWSTARFANLLTSSNRSLSAVQNTSERSVEFLGGTHTVTRYRAEADIGPAGNVSVHMATVNSGDDYVVAVAVHPRQTSERSRIDALLAGLEHSAE